MIFLPKTLTGLLVFLPILWLAVSAAWSVAEKSIIRVSITGRPLTDWPGKNCARSLSPRAAYLRTLTAKPGWAEVPGRLEAVYRINSVQRKTEERSDQ